jgi:hypothetical protein
MTNRDYLSVVSGLPRSGTSVAMQMLDAGGLDTVTDGIREADRDNPRGYYEFELVKQTAENPDWVASALGKAVKMVYKLLYDLPAEYEYRVVFMRRRVHEVLVSQQKMLKRLGKNPGPPDDRMATLFRKQVADCREWLDEQPNFRVMELDYNKLIENPRPQAERIGAFLGPGLDVDAMAAVVDPSLYRQRR